MLKALSHKNTFRAYFAITLLRVLPVVKTETTAWLSHLISPLNMPDFKGH